MPNCWKCSSHKSIVHIFLESDLPGCSPEDDDEVNYHYYIILAVHLYYYPNPKCVYRYGQTQEEKTTVLLVFIIARLYGSFDGGLLYHHNNYRLKEI